MSRNPIGAFLADISASEVWATRIPLVFLLVTSPLALRSAEACSCDANPPCSAVWRADAVFVGTVVEQAQESLGGMLHWTVHSVAVNQPLRGSVEPFVTLLPAVTRPTAEQIEASKSSASPLVTQSTCDYTFEPGRQYVIYARKTDDGRWTTSECSGTKPIERAAVDLDYIARIRAAAPTGRVYGSIERIVADSLDPAGQRGVPAVDVIPFDLPPGERPDSPTTQSSSTDDEGRFTVDAILPGRYVVAVNARRGPDISSPYATTYFPGVAREQAEVVELEEGERKTDLTIVVRPMEETTVSGVVVFNDERPVAEANVAAAPADFRGVYMGLAKTDSSGRFDLRVLAGMTYRITAGIQTERGYRRVETLLHVDQRKQGVTLSIAR